MTHVLHVIDALAIGGAERMLVELANRTAADGHRASVCVTRSELAMASRLDRRVEVLVLGRHRRFEVRPLLRLARWCREQRVDVVHCHGRSSFGLVATLIATRRLRCPVLLHDHLGVHLHPDVPPWLRVAQRYLAAYVGVSREHAAWARRVGIAAGRIHVIPNGLDLEALQHQRVTGVALARREDRPQLVCIGGIRRDKAIDTLLDATARVRSQVMLHVVGRDSDPAYAVACRDQARILGLEGRVRFEGERPDALALARDADLAVHAARSESGPLVLLEYAALGVPFVATRVGEVARTLEEAGVENFVEPDDPVALARAIDTALARPPAARARAIEAARAAAFRLLDLSAVMPAWYRLYGAVRR